MQFHHLCVVTTQIDEQISGGPNWANIHRNRGHAGHGIDRTIIPLHIDQRIDIALASIVSTRRIVPAMGDGDHATAHRRVGVCESPHLAIV